MIVWLNPLSGLSGDMLLGALLDLGASIDEIDAAVTSTGVGGWKIVVTDVDRQGVRARRAEVTIDEVVPGRAAAELIDMVARVRPHSVAQVATRAVRLLAEVEAKIHGVPVAEVHLHELGGVDTVVDTVGVAAALHSLGVTELWSGPLRLGAGQIQSAHGLIPVPAPATLALLDGVPVVGIDSTSETVTPTGAALLKAAGCRFGPMPPMILGQTGYGAGGRDTAGRPNVLPAVSGVRSDRDEQMVGRLESMMMIETTVDDVTGEVLGNLITQLLERGAADAWIAPVIGKKNRPTQVVTALCHEADAADIETVLLTETGSLGVRRRSIERRVLPRDQSEIRVAGLPVRVKSGPYHDKPEFEDLLHVARESGLTLREVSNLASTAIENMKSVEC
jgi:uncharacterized protein (TIGR00299 family) protein